MHTLLLRLQGPMQSWGTRSRFDLRDTGLEPSKSGVLGLVAAALGRDREEALDDIAGLRMGVRVDREGVLRCDYQTALDVLRADASGTQPSVQSWRYFLSGAAFLVGLAGEDRTVLEGVHRSLANPRWSLSLGRKGYLPSPPIHLPDGLIDAALEQALAGYAPLVEPPPEHFRYVLETSEGALRMDQPDAPFARRAFGSRYVQSYVLPNGKVPDVPI